MESKKSKKVGSRCVRMAARNVVEGVSSKEVPNVDYRESSL